MDDLRAAFTTPGSQVLPHLPIHGRLEGVFHRNGAAFDEEITVQGRHAHHTPKFTDERCVLDGVNIRIGHFDFGRGEEVGFDVRAVKVGMIEANRLRGVEAVEVDQLATGGGIDEARAMAAGEVEDELKTIHQDVLLEFGNDFPRGHLEFRRGRLLAGGCLCSIGCLHALVQNG